MDGKKVCQGQVPVSVRIIRVVDVGNAVLCAPPTMFSLRFSFIVGSCWVVDPAFDRVKQGREAGKSQPQARIGRGYIPLYKKILLK